MATMHRSPVERTHDRARDGGDAGRADRGVREVARDALYRRLEDGYRKVEQGLVEGRDVADWETFWIELLREYERVCDDLATDRDLAA